MLLVLHVHVGTLTRLVVFFGCRLIQIQIELQRLTKVIYRLLVGVLQSGKGALSTC